MQASVKVTKLKALLVIILLTFFITPSYAEKSHLAGFNQMADDINGTAYRLLYKLEGNTYQLSFNQPGTYELSLFPEELFDIVKTGDASFLITINNPKAMYEKHQKEPFKIKWLINEIVEY